MIIGKNDSAIQNSFEGLHINMAIYKKSFLD